MRDDYPIFTDCDAAYERLKVAITGGQASTSVKIGDTELDRSKLDGLNFL